VEIDARLVIDASGRRRSVARALGVPTQSIDRLVSRWMIGRHRGARPGVTDVAADADGWWFSTALPGERRLLSWQTDADIMPSSTEIDLVASARRNDAMGAVIRDFLPDGAGGSRAAAMTRLEHVAGPGWLAAGDAAVALDPLSSQGLFAALFTGFAAAATAHDSLEGDTAASSDYERAVDAVWERNRVLLDATYAAERRWSDRPFWRRRHERATRCAATGVR
jgi:flavin-dependent dehydrogenase